MMELDTIELSECMTKSRYNIIFEDLKNTADEINSINDELRLMRDKIILLENKNGTLVKKMQDIICTVCNLEFTNNYCQSDAVEVHDVGIECEKKPEYIDAAVQMEEEIVEVTTTEQIKPDWEIDVQIVVDTIVVAQEAVDNQLYSKADMLFYLERYKNNFFSFVQCNKNDIENISGGCIDLIRSFSNSSVSEKKIPKKKLERKPQKSGSENKSGIIDTRGTRADQGIMSCLYDDLDQETIVGKHARETITESEIEKIGGEKRVVTKNKMNLLKTRGDETKPKKIVELGRSENTDLALKHESHFPPSLEPVKEKQPVSEPKKSTETVYNPRQKTKFDNLYNDAKPLTPTILPTTVKYDMSNADSPLFHTIDTPQKLVTDVSLQKKKSKDPRNEEPLSESKTEKHSRKHEEPKPKRRHSSKKKSLKKEKDLEEGEIV